MHLVRVARTSFTTQVSMADRRKDSARGAPDKKSKEQRQQDELRAIHEKMADNNSKHRRDMQAALDAQAARTGTQTGDGAAVGAAAAAAATSGDDSGAAQKPASITAPSMLHTSSTPERPTPQAERHP